MNHICEIQEDIGHWRVSYVCSRIGGETWRKQKGNRGCWPVGWSPGLPFGSYCPILQKAPAVLALAKCFPNRTANWKPFSRLYLVFFNCAVSESIWKDNHEQFSYACVCIYIGCNIYTHHRAENRWRSEWTQWASWIKSSYNQTILDRWMANLSRVCVPSIVHLILGILAQGFENWNVQRNYPRIVLKGGFWFSASRVGPRFSIQGCWCCWSMD